MKGYVLSVICAAFALSILSALAPEGPGRGTRRLAGAIFLVLTALAPLGRADLPELDLDRLYQDAQEVVREGKEQAQEAYSGCISESLEAYILTKAAELGLEVRARVDLDREGLPRGVELTGTADPIARERLAAQIARDLGIGKEAVTWKISYQSSE